MVKQTGLICVALLSSMSLSIKSVEAKPSSTINSSARSIAKLAPKVIAQATPAGLKQISAEKKQLLRELVEMTGSKKSYEQTMQIMTTQMQKQVDSLGGRSGGTDISKFMKEFNEKFTYEQMLETVLYPTYDQYFTEADIKGMIAFYKTPTGEKVISVTPQLTQTIFKRTFEVLTPYITEITDKMKKPTRQRIKK
jgi:uncharacterized protein